MSIARFDSDEVEAEAAADQSGVLDLDALGGVDEAEVNPAQIDEAGRTLADTINRFTRPCGRSRPSG